MLLLLAASTFRNAGHVCVAPTRFLVQEASHERFLGDLVAAAKRVRVGNGLDREGPLAEERRIPALEALILDAVE